MQQQNYSVGIYVRLSKDDERARESVSIENQKLMLRKYLIPHTIHLVVVLVK